MKSTVIQLVASAALMLFYSVTTSSTSSVSGDNDDPCSSQNPCSNGFGEKWTDGKKCYCCIECQQYKRRKIKECAVTWQDCGGCINGYVEMKSQTQHEYCIKAKIPSTPVINSKAFKNKEISHVTAGSSLLPVSIVIPVVSIVFLISAAFICKKKTHRGSYVLNNCDWGNSPSVPPMEIEMKDIKREENRPLVDSTQTFIRMPEENSYEDDTVIVEDDVIRGYTNVCEDQRLLQAVPINASEPNPYATYQIIQNDSMQPNEENAIEDTATSHNEENNPVNGIQNNVILSDPNAQQDVVPNPSFADSGYNTCLIGDLALDESESSGMSFGSGYSNASTAVVGDDSPMIPDEDGGQGTSNAEDKKGLHDSEESNYSSQSEFFETARVSVNMEVNINFRL